MDSLNDILGGVRHTKRKKKSGLKKGYGQEMKEKWKPKKGCFLVCITVGKKRHESRFKNSIIIVISYAV